MTAHSDLDSAVSAYQGGAFEYLPKPFDIDQAVELVRRAGRRQRARSGERRRGRAADPRDARPGARDAAGVPRHRPPVALERAVLITGESGTGKELVARALHEHSPRASKPFIALNTSAIPAELLESELFGHEKGSFTGARRRSAAAASSRPTAARCSSTRSATCRPPLQTRLLRVLAEGEFYRVGGQTPVKVDVRVIAATHQNLEERVERGIFREDLFHRLNVIRIELPPLRSRPEDVPDLLGALPAPGRQRSWAPKPRRWRRCTLERLQRYRWPGNVRELVNLCRRLTALAPGSEIQLEDLPSEMHIVTPAAQTDWAAALTLWAKAQPHDGTVAWLDQALPEFERVLIRVALNRTHGHRQEAARVLGWGRNTLTRKLKELGMADDESFPSRDRVGTGCRNLSLHFLVDWLLHACAPLKKRSQQGRGTRHFREGLHTCLWRSLRDC